MEGGLHSLTHRPACGLTQQAACHKRAACLPSPRSATASGVTAVPYAGLKTFRANKHNESQLIVGVQQDGVRMEFWAAPDNGSWTVVFRKGNIACIHGSGPSWAPVEQSKDEGQGS